MSDHPAPGPEFTSARELADELTFDVRDRDDDQRLTPVEFERGRSVVAKLEDPDAFERYDQDRDGGISREEWLAARRAERR